MLRTFTAKGVVVFFTLGILCATLSAPRGSFSTHGFANASLPAGCAGKIPLLPGTRSEACRVLCASDQLFNILSGGFASAQTHGFSKVGQLGMGVIPADGFDGIASLKYPFHASSVTYPLHKVPIYLFDSVLTL
jgi:hypothetical protein